MGVERCIHRSPNVALKVHQIDALTGIGITLVFRLAKNGSYRQLAEFLPVKWV